MCLYSKQLKPLVATSDIRVWKVLTEDGLTPYMWQQYHRGRNIAYSENRDPGHAVLFWCSENHDVTVVCDGYLHAFREKYDADYTADVVNERNDGKTYKTVEMRIPAGAEYWEGLLNDIAATELIWDEQPEASVTKARQ
jgi:hypothetical protein